MKKVFALLLALVMLLSMTACGNDEAQNTDPDNKQNQSTAGSTGTSTDETAEVVDIEKEVTYQKAIAELQECITGYFPAYVQQDTLASLFEQFKELGDYKLASDIVKRFSIIEHGIADISVVKQDATGKEYTEVARTELYDADKNVIWVYDAEWNRTTVNFYDENGFLIYEELCPAYSKGTLAPYKTYTKKHIYNDNGQLIEVQWIRADNITEIVYKYEYNDMGQCVERNHIYAEPPSSSFYPRSYIYDDNGKCVEIKYHRNETSDNICYLSYNTEGDVILREESSWGGTYKTEFQYQNGYIIQEICTNAEGQSTFYNYTYRAAYSFNDAELDLNSN